MLGVLVLVLLLSSIVVSGEVESEDCGFFCKISNWWSSFRGNVAGKAKGEVVVFA